MGTDDVLHRGADFVARNARPLDRRLFAWGFDEGSRDAVVAALHTYRNEDGGFGLALEADVRAPESQPVACEMALRVLDRVGAEEPELAVRVCDFLETVCDPDGAVPAALDSARAYPRAAHWEGDFAFGPSLNPTAGVAGLLRAQGVRHAWLDRATDWCLRELDANPPGDAHTLLGALAFARSVADRPEGPALRVKLRERVPGAAMFALEVPVDRYALTPLHFAPSPDAPERDLFDDATLEAHLDDLLAHQGEDGGWPVYWEPPGPAAVCEWRGSWTVEALLALRAYGRI